MYARPLRDGGYDIADFFAIHPDYGTVEDFRSVRRGRAPARHPRDRRPRHEPHLDRPPVVPGVALEPRQRRSATGTSGRTPTSATRRRGSSSSTPSRRTGRGTRSPAQYYWHRFFAHQPDLNYDNPEVQEAMLDVLRFWLDLGIDGFRLDAVPYLYERDGTNGENLPETHAYLKRVRAEVDARYPDRVLLAEANQWPEDVVAVLRRRRRVPHGLPLPGHAAHVHGASAARRRRRSTRSSTGRRRSPTTRSGASSCATTTS